MVETSEFEEEVRVKSTCLAVGALLLVLGCTPDEAAEAVVGLTLKSPWAVRTAPQLQSYLTGVTIVDDTGYAPPTLENDETPTVRFLGAGDVQSFMNPGQAYPGIIEIDIENKISSGVSWKYRAHVGLVAVPAPQYFAAKEVELVNFYTNANPVYVELMTFGKLNTRVPEIEKAFASAVDAWLAADVVAMLTSTNNTTDLPPGMPPRNAAKTAGMNYSVSKELIGSGPAFKVKMNFLAY